MMRYGITIVMTFCNPLIVGYRRWDRKWGVISHPEGLMKKLSLNPLVIFMTFEWDSCPGYHLQLPGSPLQPELQPLGDSFPSVLSSFILQYDISTFQCAFSQANYQ